MLKPYRPERSLWRTRISWTAFYTGLIFVCVIYGFLAAVAPPSFMVMMAAPIFILALIVIWAMPDRQTAPTRALEWLFYAYWIGTILWPNYLAIALPGLPWISMRRLLGFPLAIILLICLSTNRAFRDAIRNVYSYNPWIPRLVFGFVLVQIISIPFSKSIVSSLYLFVDDQVALTTTFVVGSYVFLKEGRIDRWAKITCVMAIITATIGLIEFPRQQILWADHIPALFKINDESVLRVLSGQFRVGEYRATSTFALSLMFAEFLALSIPFLMHYIANASNLRVRLLWIAGYVVVFAGITVSGSRLGMVGFFVANGLYIFAWATKKRMTARQDLWASSVFFAYPAAAMAFVGLIFASHRVHRMILGGGEHQTSDDARRVQWEMGIPRILELPFFGHGPGNSGAVLGYLTPGGVNTVDSYFLTILLDYGIIGFFCFYGVFIIALVKSLIVGMKTDAPEGGILISFGCAFGAFMFIKFVLSQPDNHAAVFMMLGAVVAALYRASSFEGVGRPRSSMR